MFVEGAQEYSSTGRRLLLLGGRGPVHDPCGRGSAVPFYGAKVVVVGGVFGYFVWKGFSGILDQFGLWPW